MKYLLIVLFILLFPCLNYAETVTLIWEDGAKENDTAGFYLLYGADSTNPSKIDVGYVTTYNLDLPPGIYYFAVTGYNLTGAESVYLYQIKYKVSFVPPKNLKISPR